MTVSNEFDLTSMMQASRYHEPDTWRLAEMVELRITSKGVAPYQKFSLGFIGPEGTARREHGGPVLPGPYGYIYGLSSMLTAEPQAVPPHIDLEVGDVLIIRGHRFQIQATRDRYNPDIVPV